MNKLICLILVLMFSFGINSNAQSKRVDINSNTVFKDQLGSRISFETFLEMTSGKGYKMKPIFDDNDELIEIFVLKPSVAPNFVPPSQEAVPTHNQSKYRSAPVTNRGRTMSQPTAPKFEVTDLNNNNYNLADMRGKVVVLKFWFTGCKPCLDEIPELNSLVDQYRDNPDVVFLAAATDKVPRLQSFLQRKPFHYNIIPDAKRLSDIYMVIGYPTHIVINPRGKVEAVYKGVTHNVQQKISGAIERAFAGGMEEPAIVATTTSSSYATSVVSTQTYPKPTFIDTDIPEKEVFISPKSIIKNEAGEVVPFSEFVKLMRAKRYTLVNRRDMDNSSYVLMREVIQ